MVRDRLDELEAELEEEYRLEELYAKSSINIWLEENFSSVASAGLESVRTNSVKPVNNLLLEMAKSRL